MSTVQLNVQGMSCGACERRVRSVLMALPGVQSVIVDLKTAQVLVTGTSDSPCLVEAMNDAGYPSEQIVRLPDTIAQKQLQGGGCCCR